jgi:hypothetical protein
MGPRPKRVIAEESSKSPILVDYIQKWVDRIYISYRRVFYRRASPIDYPIGVPLIDASLIDVLLTGAIS